MSKRDVSFIDLHAEKLVLGLCVVLLLAAGVYSFGGMRFTIEGKGPAGLITEAGEQAATTAMRVRNSKPAPKREDAGKDKAWQEDLKKWFDPLREGLIQIAGIEPVPWRTQRFPPPRPEITGVAREDRHNLAKVVAPGLPIVTSGQTLMTLGQKPNLDEWLRGSAPDDASKAERRFYVSVAAQIDLVDQELNFYVEKYPANSHLTVVDVQLQRLDMDEPWRGWQEADAYLPYSPLQRPSIFDGREFKPEGVTEFSRLLEEGASHIARPLLPSRSAKLPEVPYLKDAPKDTGGKTAAGGILVKKWLGLAKKAMEGKSPFDGQDLDAAGILARAAVAVMGADEKDTETAKRLYADIIKQLSKPRQQFFKDNPLRLPDRLMPIMAHDLGAAPGHTYQYRMRYEVYNIYAGNTGELKDSSQAQQLTLFSGWSPGSRPVEVSSDVYFFLTKADPKKEEATVTVFKKTRAGWKNQDYKIQAGETIGRKEKRGPNKGVDFTTNVLCVDLDFAKTDPAPDGKRTVALQYVYLDDGQLRERFLSRDRKSKLMKRLERTRTAAR
ncbi:MAG: hypothetical protein ABII12_02435 [Planctomycetota bacterium]